MHLFCDSCHKIQPPTCENFFDLFDQNKEFGVDAKLLDRTYQGLQRKVHPDRFFRSSNQEKEFSQRLSGCINEGYQVLKNPISRGEYLLRLYGEGLSNDVPQDFLMDVLDLHEEVSSATKVEEQVVLLKKIQQYIKEDVTQLAQFLAVKDGKLANPVEGGRTIAKLKYLSRIRDTLKQKIPVDKL